jgi:hypothetical protein
MLALESKLKPIFSRGFNGFPKVFEVKIFYEIPSLVFALKENVGLLFEVVECMELIRGESIVLTEEPLTPVTT